MNAYTDYMKFANSRRRRPAPRSQTASPIRRIVEALRRPWRGRSRRSLRRGLDRLSDQHLKDVGLFREVMPNGAVRYRRL